LVVVALSLNETPPPHDKPALRAWAKARREAYPVTDAVNAALLAQVRGLPEWAQAKHVLIYLAMPGEVNVDALADEAAGGERAFYAPRCARNRRLALYRYRAGKTPLRPGPFGIREPDPHLAWEVVPDALDLVIVPALLLTPDGDRLGYGGGYYDRFMPTLPAGCVRVGVLPETQIVAALPRDAWDAPLDVIVTERRVLRPGDESPVSRDKMGV